MSWITLGRNSFRGSRRNGTWTTPGSSPASRSSSWPRSLSPGNIKSQLKNQRAEDDTYSGWLFAIDAYRRLKAHDDFKSPAIEALAKMQAEGKLLQHAKDLQASEEQEDQSDNPPKPLALGGVSALPALS